MFDTARADYAAGQWSLAITGFDAFLKTFPRSEMADDAQFYIGETYYAQNRWTDAIAAYNQVIQNYPMGNAVPDAYYKRGLAQERLGQLDAARESWNTAVKNYPDSDAEAGWRSRISIGWPDGPRRSVTFPVTAGSLESC